MSTGKQDIVNFYNRLAQFSAQQEEALTVMRSQLDGLIAGWPEDPPPPAPTNRIIRFAIHKYDNKTPVDFDQADVFDLQRGFTVGANPRSPETDLFLYTTMVRRSGDTNGYTQFLRPANVPSSWCAHLRQDPTALVTRPINGGDTLINISNLSWQNLAIANIVSAALAHNATGIYLDEVDWSISFGWPILKNFQCLEFPNDAAWRAALLGLIQNLADALHDNGKKLWINYGANSSVDPAWHNSILRVVDAVNSEFFVGREGVGKGPSTLMDGWAEQTNFVAEAEKLGIPAHVRCSSAKKEVVDYAFLSWLMVTEFLGSFSASTSYSGIITDPSGDLYAKAVLLGRPTAAYAVSAYGYYRQFENGVARVNPFATAKNGAAPMTGSIVLT